jgi:radical SAM protein with 4Fe4S-binding SPASM domain
VSGREPGAQQPLIQEVAAKYARLNTPILATLELTYRCNLKCGHCYNDRLENDELTFDEWREVLTQLKAAGIIFLTFTGGEILLEPDALAIVRYARDSGFRVGLLTNGTLVTPDIARAIAELKPFSMVTSLYGATAATHESITKVPGSFEATLQGIRLLVGAGLVPIVQTLVMNNNLEELPRIKELVAQLGADSTIYLEMTPSRSGSGYPLEYEPDFAGLASCGMPPNSFGSGSKEGKLLCQAGKSSCSISPSGDVYPCVLFPLKLGNIRQTSFDSMWRLEPCAELRYLRSMRRSDLYACSECELSAYCKRCTGVAYLESGCINGPSPSACRQAQKRWRLTQATEVKSCQESPTLNLI